MDYINGKVRRQDRLLDEPRARQLLCDAEYGVLSMVDDGEQAYGIPVNFVWNGADSIYIHCAPDGRKLRVLSHHPKVSLCVVGNVNLMARQFTTEYESVVVFGEAHTGLSADERMHALHLLVDKLAPEYRDTGYKYAKMSFHRTEIIRIDVTEFSGKRKQMHGKNADKHNTIKI